MSDESGQLFFKPVHQQEIEFYESAFKDHPDFAAIMPPFYGTLSRNEPTKLSSEGSTPTESGSSHEEASTSESPAETPATPNNPDVDWVPNKNRRLDTHQYIVLENASTGYTHANILDAKLGVRLWADDAPQAKKRRFDQIANETTHKNFGFRIAGMRVYHANASVPEQKQGKKPAFEVEGDYKVYDKDYGRYYVDDDNLKEALRGYVFNEAAGIDEELGKAVCAAFVHDLEKIRDALENEESRMYSASCLFIFEGDGNMLRRSIEAQNRRVEALEQAASAAALRKNEKVDAGVSRQDSGVCLEDEPVEVAVLPTIGEHAAVQVNGTPGATTVVQMTSDASCLQADGSDDDEEEEEVEQRACGVQLIDFAHAQWRPGLGPDENSLKGVRSLIKLFKELAE